MRLARIEKTRDSPHAVGAQSDITDRLGVMHDHALHEADVGRRVVARPPCGRLRRRAGHRDGGDDRERGNE